MPSPIDDEILQRFHDGDLPPAEARALSARIAGDPGAQRRLAELARLRTLVRQAAQEASAGLDSDALFRAIEARLPQHARPSIAPSQPAQVHPIGRRRGLWVPVLAATAVAAATLLVVLRSGERDGGGGEAIPPVAVKLEALTEQQAGEDARIGAEAVSERSIGAEDDVALVRTAQGSRLERVDFGRNSGTAFLIEGDGVGVTVVWLNDEDAP